MKQLLKANVPESNLVQLFFTWHEIGSIQWTKEDKEFQHSGEMYDVVRTVDKSDGVLFFCIHDVKESKLFKHLDDYVESHVADNPQNQKKAKWLQAFSMKDIFHPISFNFKIYKDAQALCFINATALYVSRIPDLEPPPPKRSFILAG